MQFPVTLKRRNSIGKVVTVSCVTVKDATRILRRFGQSGYSVWIEDADGRSVAESDFLNTAPRSARVRRPAVDLRIEVSHSGKVEASPAPIFFIEALGGWRCRVLGLDPAIGAARAIR